MREVGGKAKKISWYGVVIGISYLLLQQVIYMLGHFIGDLVGITPILPKIPAIDDAIPIISIFVITYIWSYIFWAMGPMAVSKCESDHFRDYLAATILAVFAGVLVLIFVPTYMDRNAEGLYAEMGYGIFDKIRLFIYSMDGGEIAFNLFPSFHCLNSTLCFLGVMERKEIPKWFRVYSCVMMILVFASTVCLKQHYVPDVFCGIAIAVISFIICKKWHWGRIFLPIARAYRKKHNK